jgi:hypothetical protein
MSIRVYQLAKDLAMDNRVVMQLLKERGLTIASASSSIPNIYANALIEELKNSSQSIVTPAPEPSPVGEKVEKITPPIEEESPKKDDTKDLHRGSTQKEQSKEKPSKSGDENPSAAPIGEKEKKSVGSAKERKGDGVIVANAHGGPPKGSIKIPLPKVVPKVLPLLGEKNSLREKSSDKVTPTPKPEVSPIFPVQREDAGKNSESGESGSTITPPQSKSVPLRTEVPVQDRGGEATMGGARRKTTPANSDEKRTPPTVRFQFTPKSQRSEPFNGIKIAEIPGLESKQTVELKPLVCKAPLVVRDFAQKIGLKPFQLISELMGRVFLPP